MIKAPIYLVFGPQGSGKSTQAELIADKLSLPFFDSGSELRKIAEQSTEKTNKLRSDMKKGNLVSNKILREIFDEFIKSHDCSRGLVIDGFPRNDKQVKLLEDLSNHYSWEIIVFFIDISDKTAKERLSKRYKLIEGRKIFRNDDKPAIVQKRLNLFKEETLPVVEQLKKKYRFHNINGEPSKSEVFTAITEHLESKND